MNTLTRLRTALAGRYEVEQELGRGGMAVVFLGRDLRLERRVAIKVFERQAGQGAPAERFLREIRIAAQLQHPNILPVHDSGEAEGLVYYVMPYVAGQSLRERLEKEGPLPVADAVRIAREVAEALDHAHQAGIVHRDIKPDNIMLSGGVAVVADFGIARALEQGGGKLTDTGLAIGTPNYMSPEQATAQPTVDGRADIYALGCVLYEMLAGAPPFSGPTAQAVMARHTADAVPPLSTVREVPPALEAAVVKALAKAPADRWATGRALAEALENADRRTGDRRTDGLTGRNRFRVGVAAAGLVIVAAGAWLAAALAGESSSEAVASLRSVAVLPFTLSGDSANAVLAEGLTEGVSTGLVQVEGLSVISGGRVRAYRDRDTDPRDAGRSLGVNVVLSAVVRVAANRLRVTAQLTDVTSGAALWQQQFNGELVVAGSLQDVFSIQDSLTAKIVAALQPRLGAGAAGVRGVRTRDPEAYRLYLRGRQAYWAGDIPGARGLYEQALARDSLYADAWAALGDAIDLSAGTPVEVALTWRRAIERAIELDSLNTMALMSRGWLKALHEWDWDAAWRDIRRAVELAPGAPDIALEYSNFLLFVNRLDSATIQARRAVTLDPGSAAFWTALGHRFILAGRPDSALSATRRALALDSTAYDNLLLIHARAGRFADADRVAERLVAERGTHAGVLDLVAHYYGRVGNAAEARRVLGRLTALARRESVPLAAIATARLATGDRLGALDAIEQGARERDLALPWALHQRYHALRGEPRFEAVRRKVYGDRPLLDPPF